MVIFKKSLTLALAFYYSITMKAGCDFFYDTIFECNLGFGQ